MRVRLMVDRLKRWRLGARQGAVRGDRLDGCMNELSIRCSRRTPAAHGKRSYLSPQQAVQIEPVAFAKPIRPQLRGGGGVRQIAA